MQHTAYSIHHTAYSIQHTAYNNSIHHAAAKPQNAREHLGVDGVGYQKVMKNNENPRGDLGVGYQKRFEKR